MKLSKNQQQQKNQILMFFLLVSVTTVLMVSPVSGEAERGEESYSFVVFGDSRIPAYAPYDKNNKEKLDELIHLITRYAYSGQEEPPYEAFYNPNTLQLERIELPGEKEGQSRIITYGRDGWPDVFLNREDGKAQVGLLASGQEWVYDWFFGGRFFWGSDRGKSQNLIYHQ
jgi:hypothetical protein